MEWRCYDVLKLIVVNGGFGWFWLCIFRGLELLKGECMCVMVLVDMDGIVLFVIEYDVFIDCWVFKVCKVVNFFFGIEI